MALNTITQVKLPNGGIVDIVNWTDQPLFSSLDMQTGFTTQEISLFQYVSGDTMQSVTPITPAVFRTATDNDTNIATPGAMASTEEMLVYAIKPEVYGYTLTVSGDFTTRTYDPADAYGGAPTPTNEMMAVLAQALILELEISQKIYAQASIAYFNTGFGMFSLSGATDNTAASFGIPSQQAVRSFVIPHHIGSQEKYRVKLVNSGNIGSGSVDFGILNVEGLSLVATTAATLRVNLDGLYKRPTA